MTTTTEPWFSLLTETVAQYIDDYTTEVYAMRAEAPHFIRTYEDDGTLNVYLLTNDRAELIAGEARLTHLPDETVASIIEAMLR